MSRRIGRRIALAVGVPAVLLGVFLYGFVVSRTQMAPYGAVMKTVRSLRAGDSFLIRLYDRATGSAGGGGQATRPGHWSRAADAPATGDLQAEEIERLRAIGYLGAEEQAPATTGVTVHDADRAGSELLLYTSGHGPVAVLMDRDGTVLHAWRRSFEDAFPGVPAPADQPSFHYFRKAHLFDNGDLIVLFEGKAILKLDRNSNILWAHRNGAHHDMHVADNGEIYVLTREAHVNPSYHPTRPILEDYVSILDARGEELHRYSLLEAVQSSNYSPVLDFAPEGGDILHTNSLEILDGSLADRSPAFAAGNALVSFNRINLVGVVDLENVEMKWALTGMTSRNHDPTFLDSGNLLIFDNSGGTGGRSRVIEVDPFTQQVVWGYFGDEDNGFYSECCGTNHRLANGNTLITETTAGHAFEVTPENEIVWEFFNPHRGGENDELIAYVLEMLPIPADQPLDWLEN